MKSLILYFFLLILKVLFHLAPDTVYKCGQFSKTLSKKGLKFVPKVEINLILFFEELILLPSEVNFITEK